MKNFLLCPKRTQLFEFIFAVWSTSPMDSIHKPHPKPVPSAATPHHHHHRRKESNAALDPPIASPSAMRIISNHISKLYYANDRKKPAATPNSLKPTNLFSHPHFQEKVPPVSDTSCTTLTKSKSHNERKHDFAASKVAQPFDGLVKKSPLKETPNGIVGSRSQSSTESSTVDEQQGRGKNFKFVGIEEGRRRLSTSSLPPAAHREEGGGRRKSFCGGSLQIEQMSDFFSCNGVKTVAVDMPPFMQIHAVNCARKAHDSLEKFTSKTLAFTMKKEFDAAYGPAWHCIVGSSFGSFVTHSVGGFMYFSMDHKLYILLFKTSVQKAKD